MPKNVFSGDSLNQDGEVADANDVNKYGLYGDGSDGSYNSGDNLEPGKVYNFTDFTLEAGDTLSSTASNSGEPIIVKVQGDVVIDGTIDLSGQGYAGADGFSNTQKRLRSGYFVFGPGSRGASGFIDSGTPLEGVGGNQYPSDGFMNISTGDWRAFAGTGGGAGDADFNEGGAGGGGGASYGADGNEGETASSADSVDVGSGSAGGGAMVVICDGGLSFTGSIDISGIDGSNEDNNGGGGGAGGMFYGVYSGSLTDSGSKTVTGGTGGTAFNNGADGGDGANGTILFESVS